MIFFKHFNRVRDNYWLLKSFLIMRITLALIVLFNLQAVAKAFSQATVTLNLKSADFKSVLAKIEQQSTYHFVYSERKIPAAVKVNVQVENKPVLQLLEELLTGTGFTYNELDNHLVVIFPAGKTVNVIKTSGKVLDEKGQPLPGATVKIKGTATGTQTDAEGSFSLEAPENAVLEISFVGYVTKEIVVKGNAFITVDLSPAEASLKEILVIGYGTRERKDVTGSVSSVSAAKIKDLPVASIDQKLIGQMPGVQIASTTGAPGGGTTIKVRGSGSIGAGDNPLYVIDGFAISNTSGQAYNPLNVLSPDDIESVTVLKDASSTAIYGSRGSNGVIVITTKKGKKGAPVVSVNAYAGVQQVPQKGRPQVLNGQEYAQFRKDMIVDLLASQGKTATDADIPEPFRNPAQYGAGTNWYDAVLRTAIQNNLDASIRGGNDATQYSFSVGRLQQDGTIRYTDFNRYTLQANVQSKISRKLQVGLNLAPSGGIQKRNGYESGQRDVLTRTLWLSPIVPINGANGSRTLFITSPGAIGAGNPLNTLEFAGTNAKYFRGLASAFAELEIIEGLKAKYTFNIDYTMNRAFTFNPSFVYGETSNQNPNPSIPGSSTSNSNNFNWLSEFVLSYDKTFGVNHRLSALAGYTAQKERGESYGFNATNYPDNLVQTVNAAALINGQSAGVEKWSLISYLARVNYTFKEKYLLTATIRTDGSSRFGANVRYGTFPSVALGWRASEENFVKDNLTFISNLKFRGSYGRTGNFNIGNYAYASSIGSANYTFGGGLASGRVSNSVSNQTLSWEKADQLDVGIDLSVFRDRVNFTLDYYNRITTDMLLNNEIPMSSGFASSLVNLGKIRNRGFEFSVNSVNLNGALSWNTNFNISFNKNKVLALNQDNAPIYAGRSGEGNFTHKTEVGKPLGQFFGYIVEGVYRDQADFNSSPKNASSVVGSIKYRDVDGNGIIEPVKDFAVIGDPYADFTYGLTNTFGYKSFDLNVLVVGSQGGQIMKTSNEFMTNIDGVFNVDRKVLSRWRSPQNQGDGVTPTTNGGRVIYRDVNSGWIEDASFLRIQNITLGYNFKQKFITNSNVFKALRLYGSIQNVATFTKYSGGNPEALTNGAGVTTPGRDFVGYPLPRTITVGLNMTF